MLQTNVPHPLLEEETLLTDQEGWVCRILRKSSLNYLSTLPLLNKGINDRQHQFSAIPHDKLTVFRKRIDKGTDIAKNMPT